MFDPAEMSIEMMNKDQERIWRERLRYHLLMDRPYCDGCGKLLIAAEVHEGIVTRQDVRGWKYPDKGRIFSEYNSLLLCPECHRPSPPSRQECWTKLCRRFGEELITNWYFGLPWRSGPPRYFQCEGKQT